MPVIAWWILGGTGVAGAAAGAWKWMTGKNEQALEQIHADERTELELGNTVMKVGLASLGAVLLMNAMKKNRSK